MLRKITRILLKTTGVITLLLVILATTLYFGIQSYTFQTWLGKKAGNYLSKELNAVVVINKIELDFFTKAHLQGIYISDQHKDTLLKGDVLVSIKNFDLKKQQLELKEITLKNITAKLITYKNDSTLNYQFLYDYFASESVTDSTTKKAWDVKLGDIYVENLCFSYKNENLNQDISENMNFNNLLFTGTYAKIMNFKLIDGDNIEANIRGLRTKEQCGFQINKLNTNAKASYRELALNRLLIETPQTTIKGFINFKYNDWADYSDFTNKIKINSELEETHVNSKDIATFTKELNGLNETIHISGKIKGYITDLSLKDFNFGFKKHTRFRGNLTLTGLPDITTGFLRIDADEIASSYSDLSELPDFPFTSGKKLDIPIQLKQLGVISYKGKFDGFMNDFSTSGEFRTALGRVKTNLGVLIGEKIDDTQYKGNIETKEFNIGALAGVVGLNNMHLTAEVKGTGISINALNTEIKGQLLNLTYNHYNYQNISMNGTFKEKVFNGLLLSKDPNADFDFDGKISFKTKIPEMDFMSTINNINLQALNFSKEKAQLSSQVLIVLKGDNLNNLTGNINLDNTTFRNNKKAFKFSVFDIKLEQENIDKSIVLTSNYFNFNMAGRYNLTNLPVAFNHFLSSYYPAFVTKIKTKNPYTDAFKFNLKIKKFNTISELVVQNLMISPNTIIGGDFDITKNLFNINLKSDSIRLEGITFHKNVVESFSQNNKINLVFKGEGIQLTDSVKLENYFMYLVSKDKETKYNLEWDNKILPKTAGKIAGKLIFSDRTSTLNFDKFFITARDSTWNIATTNPAVLDTNGHLTVNPLLFTNGNQSIGIAGKLSKNIQDNLVINTANVSLEQFNPILQAIKLETEGVLNGSVSLFHSNGFALSSDLNFGRFKINKNFLGMVVLKTNFNAAEKNIFLDGYTSLGVPDLMGNQSKNISFKGFYYLDKKDESIDINFTASPANLKLLNPMLEGVLTINNALAVGEGKIHGSADNLKIDGKLKMYNADIKVDYTNVTYIMNGEVEIMPDQIRFSDITMKEKGSKASTTGTINGNMFHKNFSNIQLDYDVSYKNMLVLNTSEKENKTFYGKIYGTGNIGIWGSLNNLHMQVNVATNKNSKFFLPLDGPAEVEESDFVHFVKKDTIKTKIEDKLTGFNLEMFVGLTPDLQAQIILDKAAGDVLNVQGLGDLTLKINTLGKFEMLGVYNMTDGDYRFSLENVINKKFDIDEGSSISWSGDPLAADINIITSYRQRASVAPLLNDTTGTYKGRIPVDCKLKITDKLFAPNIKFGIEFPSIDATARARIDNLLTDEMELNRQVFSFLLFRTFVTPQIYNTAGGGVSAGNAAASTGSEMLSNKVSSFLNSYVGNLTGLGDLDLGLNYRAGSQNSSDAVDLALSKQLFNNKVSIDGNFGVNSSQTSKNSSGIIDVNIEYKLTEDGRYRVKGFNRSNDNTQITATGGPYTQGIGLFYREEFETFNDLFNRYLSKFKKKEEKPAN